MFPKLEKPIREIWQKKMVAEIPMEQGNKGNAMKNKKRVTQSEIAAALQQFISKGGVIHHLPEQQYCSSRMIGDEKYGPWRYEEVVGFVRADRLSPSDLVWHEGLPDLR